VYGYLLLGQVRLFHTLYNLPPLLIPCLRYLEIQNIVENFQPGASYYNNDIIGVAGLTIFAGVYTATVFVSYHNFFT